MLKSIFLNMCLFSAIIWILIILTYIINPNVFIRNTLILEHNNKNKNDYMRFLRRCFTTNEDNILRTKHQFHDINGLNDYTLELTKTIIDILNQNGITMLIKNFNEYDQNILKSKCNGICKLEHIIKATSCCDELGIKNKNSKKIYLMNLILDEVVEMIFDFFNFGLFMKNLYFDRLLLNMYYSESVIRNEMFGNDLIGISNILTINKEYLFIDFLNIKETFKHINACSKKNVNFILCKIDIWIIILKLLEKYIDSKIIPTYMHIDLDIFTILSNNMPAIKNEIAAECNSYIANTSIFMFFDLITIPKFYCDDETKQIFGNKILKMLKMDKKGFELSKMRLKNVFGNVYKKNSIQGLNYGYQIIITKYMTKLTSKIKQKEAEIKNRDKLQKNQKTKKSKKINSKQKNKISEVGDINYQFRTNSISKFQNEEYNNANFCSIESNSKSYYMEETLLYKLISKKVICAMKNRIHDVNTFHNSK